MGENKYYGTTEIIEEIKKSGITNAKTMKGLRQTLYYWIKSGKLTLKRRLHTKQYVATKDDIKNIIREFGPGGSGEYHAE